MTENENPGESRVDEFLQSAMDAMKEEDTVKAAEFFDKARVFAEEFEDDRKAATACHMLGVCAQLRKDYKEAEKWFSKTVDIKERIGAAPFMIDTIAQVGSMRYEQGLFDKAVLHYGNAYLIAVKFEIPIFMRLLADLASLSRELGEEEFLRIWKEEFEDIEPPMEKMKLIQQPGKLIEALMSGRMTKEEFAEKWTTLFPGMEPPIDK